MSEDQKPRTVVPKMPAPKAPATNNAGQELINSINDKFQGVTNQLMGLVQWITKAVNKIERELRTQSIRLSVQDVATTSLIKVLVEKGIMTEAEYKAVAQQTYADALEEEKPVANALEVPKSESDIKE